jgi:hypothetical protein
MKFIGAVTAAVCAAALLAPQSVSAQATTRVRDSIATHRREARERRELEVTLRRQRRDSVMALRQTTIMTSGAAASQQRLKIRKDVKGVSFGTLDDRAMMARDDSIAEVRRREAVDRANAEALERSLLFSRDSMANVERMRLEAVARDERMRLEAIEAARRDSVMRADALAEQERIRRQEMQGQYRFRGTGFYVGAAAGAVVPTGNLNNLGYNSGFNVNIPIGWHKQNQVFGARMDLGYAQFRGRDFSGRLVDGSGFLLNNNSPKIFSATLNLTAHLPLIPSHNLNAYALTGLGVYQFREFGSKSSLGGFLGNDLTSTNGPGYQSVRNKAGAQFGAGLEYGIGPAALYVESRVVNVFAHRADNVQFNDFFGANRGQNVRWVPIMVGVNFR